MWKVTLKGLLAHKLRLALTALAIVLGVTFISGTFVLTDTLHNTFSSLFGNIYAKVDFQVRGVAQLGSGGNAVRNQLSQSLLPTVRSVPGVATAQGEVSGYAQYIAPDGKAIQTGGAPTLAVNFDPDPRLSSLHLVDGTAPAAASDVVMDAGTAQKYGFRVGQQVRVLTTGPTRTFTISGIAEFGTANNLAGATVAAFALPTAQSITGESGKLGDINVVTAPGASKPAVQQAIARVLPAGVQVVTGQTVVSESTDSINQALGFFSTALLVFAFISLFVGGFTIFNTFSIIVGQRTRELALLRIVGASRRQVFRSVLTEAALTGLVSSVIGLGLGVLAALGLQALLRGFGVTLPPGSLVFEPRTALVGLGVGVGVTVVAAIGPARGAVRIAPVAALDDRRSRPTAASLRRRFIAGGVLGLFGVALLAVGLAQPAIELVGVGAVGVFLGAATLAPAIARPLSSVIGRPLARVLGEPGKLGRQNSMRSPRRTAQTASALMVGLALVAAMSVFGASVSRSATSSADQAISADLIVTPSGPGELSNSAVRQATGVAGVSAATRVYNGQFEFGDTLSTLTAVSTANLASTVILRMTSGTAAALGQGGLLIDSTTAQNKHLAVGDTAPARFARTGPAQLRIGGIYEANALIGSYLVSSAFYQAHFQAQPPVALLLRTGGADNAVTSALAPYPNIQVQTKAQFEQAQVASVNQLLGLVYALLALAVLVALIGIVNTLMLSVFERTREIGLLRAVGMRRRQVRTMIRSEAVILAIFGAIIGIVIGTAMGVALVSSLKQQGITDTVVPVPSLIIFLVLAAILGLIAATWPARRAARLDVLAAIAAQ